MCVTHAPVCYLPRGSVRGGAVGFCQNASNAPACVYPRVTCLVCFDTACTGSRCWVVLESGCVTALCTCHCVQLLASYGWRACCIRCAKHHTIDHVHGSALHLLALRRGLLCCRTADTGHAMFACMRSSVFFREVADTTVHVKMPLQ